jgi:hypothetical protein
MYHEFLMPYVKLMSIIKLILIFIPSFRQLKGAIRIKKKYWGFHKKKIVCFRFFLNTIFLIFCFVISEELKLKIMNYYRLINIT